jgi:outer membrane protein TolC
MAQVFGAHLNERLAGEYLEVAARNLRVQEARLAAVEARAAEGLALTSERLDARALRDEAEMEWTHLNYRHQLSAALLRHAMGVPFDGIGGDAECESD